jgi:hypothetical protein
MSDLFSRRECRLLLVLFVFVAACGGFLSSNPSKENGNDGGEGAGAAFLEGGVDSGVLLEGGVDSGTLDAGTCLIDPSDYNRSCSAAMDCVAQAGAFPVQFGDFCQPDTCWCGGGTINRDAVAQYVADVSKTAWGRDAYTPPACSCPQYGLPCCVAGQCTLNCPVQCSDCADGSPDTGMGLQDGSVLCSLHEGPVDGGEPDVGPVRLCVPPESCSPVNGVWECCTTNGITVCVPPVGED